MDIKLYDEIFCNTNNTIHVRKGLARAFGLEKGAILTQLEGWINAVRRSNEEYHFRDGRWWVWNTLEQWHEKMDYCSDRTMRRHIDWFKEQGIIIVRNDLNALKYDRTYWYTIDYDTLERIYAEKIAEKDKKSGNSAYRNYPESHVDKMTTSTRTNCPSTCGQNVQDNTIVTNTIVSNNIVTPVTNIEGYEQNKERKRKSASAEAKSSFSAKTTAKPDCQISLEKSLKNLEKVRMEDDERKEMTYLTTYFFSTLYVRTRQVHHVLSVPQIQRIYDSLTEIYEPLTAYRKEVVWQIHSYFNDFIKRDDVALTMEHFATNGILKIGDYKLESETLVDEHINYIDWYKQIVAEDESLRKPLLLSAT